MAIKRLKDFPQQPEPQLAHPTPQCCADIKVWSNHEYYWRMQRYNDGGTKPLQCVRPSVVEINGKHYCRLHGGHVVLDMYLNGELVEK